jgi:hypothetical protein
MERGRPTSLERGRQDVGERLPVRVEVSIFFGTFRAADPDPLDRRGASHVT